MRLLDTTIIDSENEDDHIVEEDHEQQNLDQLKQIMQANQQSELLDSLPEQPNLQFSILN